MTDAAAKIGMGWFDDVVEARDLLMELSADSADEPVAERRHPSQENRRAGLGASVGLRQRRECDTPSVIAA